MDISHNVHTHASLDEYCAKRQRITQIFEQQNIENTKFSNQIAQQSSNVTSAIIESQKHFNNYIKTKNKESFVNYLKSISDTKSAIDRLEIDTKKNDEFNAIWNKKQNTENSILKINTAIDSILNYQTKSNFNELEAPIIFNPFKYNKILDSVKTNTFISVDNVAKKGLMGRISRKTEFSRPTSCW